MDDMTGEHGATEQMDETEQMDTEQMDDRYWDARYGESGQVWSGRPNGVLVGETADLPPGHALDVGCGEGGDARWLAARGWRVTAVDVSRVALRRAAAHKDMESLAGLVAWEHRDLTSESPPPAAFDLVSAHYFPMPRTRPAAARGLVDAVAPGGTLLVVGHDHVGSDWHGPGGLRPHDCYEPGDFVALLGEGWAVCVDETRPRVDPAPPGTHHSRDTVLRAVRRP
jgi:SAM-dependent methyltransferase